MLRCLQEVAVVSGASGVRPIVHRLWNQRLYQSFESRRFGSRLHLRRSQSVQEQYLHWLMYRSRLCRS